MSGASQEARRAPYFALQRLARQQRRDTQELLTLYALEGLLARLAASDHREQLVVKGGMLLAAFAQRRPTRDLDLHAQRLDSDVDTVRQLIADIATLDLDDGLDFDTSGATAQVIREGDQYSGVRVSLAAGLHTARLTVKVDVNVGDPIWPASEDVTLPRLLSDEPLILRGYPLHMVLAEKLVTATDRGVANTQWRDFADIYLLSRHHPVDGTDLAEAILRVADHRGVELARLTEVLDELPGLAQSRWVAWRAKQDLTDRLPEAFADVVGAVIALGDPAATGAAAGASWRPDRMTWVSNSTGDRP